MWSHYKAVNWSIVVMAGLCGGLAEILWVGLYTGINAGSGVEIARQVTLSLFPALSTAPLTAPLGIVIHFSLSLFLAAGVALFIWRPGAQPTKLQVLMNVWLILTAVWAINFFMVLPQLNPVFVSLLPYGVTLVSKWLFALAMASVLMAEMPVASQVRLSH